MPRPEIIVKAHIENEAVLFPEQRQAPFKSIADAASFMRDQFKYAPIEYVLEIEKDANGISRGYDRREEFETAWLAEAYNDAIWAHSEQPKNHRDNVTLNEFLNNAEGPTFCEGEAVKVSRGVDLIAAE